MTDWWPWLRDLGRKHLAGILAAMAAIGLLYVGALEGPQAWSLDQFFELRRAREPTLNVAIVTVDESSMAELNQQWPFPRAMHGELIRKIAEGRPLAIVFDIVLDTPSSRGPADDKALAAAVANA